MQITEEDEKTLFWVRFAGIITTLIVGGILLATTSAHACVRDAGTLKSNVREKYESLKQQAANAGIEIIITCAERSQADQDKLYQQGRTMPGKIVTWVKQSKHTQGLAFDVAVKERGGITWEPSKYRILGEIGQKLGLIWGGSWKEQDLAHFEVNQ